MIYVALFSLFLFVTLLNLPTAHALRAGGWVHTILVRYTTLATNEDSAECDWGES